MAKGKPFMGVQLPEMSAAFADKQFIINQSHSEPCQHTKMYRYFVSSITRLLYSNFEWTGDITPVEAQFIERQLITTGRVVAMKSYDPAGVYFGIFGTPTEAPVRTYRNNVDEGDINYDFYGQPTVAQCVGLNGVSIFGTQENFVLGYDTLATSIIAPIVDPYVTYINTLAELLDNAYGAWRVATETNKLGMVFNAPDETSARIMRKLLEDISDNKPFIITRGNMANRTDVAYRPGTQGVVGAYYQNFLNAWSMVLDLLGVENESAQKRERMVVEEAVRNNSLSKSIGCDRLRARQNFADEVRRKLGKNIGVHNAFTAILDDSDVNGNGRQDDGENNVKESRENND